MISEKLLLLRSSIDWPFFFYKYEELFDAVVAWKLADRSRRNDKVLSRVSGAGLEARRQDFIERDRQKIKMDRLAVAKNLIGRRPPIGSSLGPRKTWTEMALLKREFDKERRFAPVRDLISRAGGAVQALKPCFMMPPLSMAKFLPATKIDFDLLVVDEASQMRPEDALGGIMRVKQLVVVGDAKQLPPRYHSSKSARDRDRLREEILTRLGWNILRVWSADWFDNPSRETDKICGKIEAIKKARQLKRRSDYQFRSTPVDKEVVADGLPGQEALDTLSEKIGPETLYVETSSIDCAILLRNYRDTVVAREMVDWEPQRSLLRDGMIETLVAQCLDDPGDWFTKVPLFQRTGTNPIEKEKYLAEVCDIIGQHSSSLQ